MMKIITSLVLFTSTLKADVCMTGDGNMNTGFYGHYVELGQDENGYMQYKEKTICGDNYLYNDDGMWATSNSLGSSRTNIRCSSEDSSITTPMDCPEWSQNSVSVTDTDCNEVVLTCDTIEISGAFTSSNGVYDKVENEENLYKKEGANYWFLFYANGRYFIGTDDGDVRCSNSIGYNLQIEQSSLSTLKDGVELTFTPMFPNNTQITIQCSGNSTPKPTTQPPSISGTVINTPAPTTSTTEGPDLAGSSDGDICISRSSDSNYNEFFGNYVYAGKDSNGNSYYEKEQAHCDDEPEYLYLTTNGYWHIHKTLGVNYYYLRCPTQNIATPDLCADNWLTGGNGQDPEISASNEACPEKVPSLSCNYIQIEGANNNWYNRIYAKIDENLYQRPSSNYYLQYYKQGGYYIIWTSDVRDACPNTQYYYLRADNRNIDNLKHGDTLSVSLVYPENNTVNFKCLASSST